MLSTSSPVNDPGDLEAIFIRTGEGRYVRLSLVAGAPSIVAHPLDAYGDA